MKVTELRRAARIVLLAIMAASLLAFAGCGDDDEDTGGGGGNGGEAAQEAPAEETATSVPTIEELTGDGAFESEPPTEGPPPAKGKSVWWVSCGMQIPDCALPANNAKEAAKQLGIKFNIADGKLNVGGGNVTAMRTALAAKPDLMIIHGIGCPGIRQPLKEAKAQGVLVMGVESLDCSDPPTNGEKLFTTEMKYSEKAVTGVDYFRAWGKVNAQYIIAATNGEAKYISNAGQEPLQKNVDIGFDEEMKASCPKCEQVQELEFNSADLVPNGPWIQEFRSALTRNTGKFNVVQVPFDVNLLVGGAKALKDSGADAMLIGGSGSPASFDLVRSGQVTAITAAHSLEWMGFGAMDNANRALQDEETVPQGVGFRPVSKEHNLPPKGEGYVSPIDWRAAYDKLWSSGG